MKKARQLRDALARAWDHPERVALPRQNIGAKVLTAAVVGATGVAAKALTVNHFVDRYRRLAPIRRFGRGRPGSVAPGVLAVLTRGLYVSFEVHHGA